MLRACVALQAQLLLQHVEWPEKLLNPGGGIERGKKSSILTQALQVRHSHTYICARTLTRRRARIRRHRVCMRSAAQVEASRTYGLTAHIRRHTRGSPRRYPYTPPFPAPRYRIRVHSVVLDPHVHSQMRAVFFAPGLLSGPLSLVRRV